MSVKKFYKYSEVKDKVERVAFDVVRFKSSDPIEGLWKIVNKDNEEYIVAMYDDQVKTASSPWEINLDHQKNINVFYKNTPVTKIAASSLGILDEEVDLVPRYLGEKLATNENLLSALLSALPDNQRKELFNRFPELRK